MPTNDPPYNARTAVGSLRKSDPSRPTTELALTGSAAAVDCSKGALARSLGQKVVLSFNGYWGKRSE